MKGLSVIISNENWPFMGCGTLTMTFCFSSFTDTRMTQLIHRLKQLNVTFAFPCPIAVLYEEKASNFWDEFYMQHQNR